MSARVFPMQARAPNVQGKAPPHDLEDEADLVSNAITKPGGFDAVCDIVKPEMFYSEAHQWMWRAAAELSADCIEVSPITVRNWLSDRKRLGIVDGPAGLDRVFELRTSIHNFERLAYRVRDLWRLRELSGVLWQKAAECYGDVGDDVQGFIEQAEAQVSRISQSSEVTGSVSLGDSIQKVFRNIEAGGGGGIGYRVGLEALDNITNGFEPGDLVIVAARPGMGKSALAMQIATHIAATDDVEGNHLASMVFSLEMPHEQLSLRAVCSLAGVDSNRLKGNHCDATDWRNLTDAAKWLAVAPVELVDKGDVSPLTIRSMMRRYRTQLDKRKSADGRPTRLGVVVVDYLQLLNGQALVRKNDSREQEVAKCSSMLKQIAKEFGVVVVALSQLSRKCEERKDKRPMLSDLRESGAVEQDADRIVFVYRDEYYLGEKTPGDMRGVAELIVAKQRNGRLGTARVEFVDRFTLFRDLKG